MDMMFFPDGFNEAGRFYAPCRYSPTSDLPTPTIVDLSGIIDIQHIAETITRPSVDQQVLYRSALSCFAYNLGTTELYMKTALCVTVVI